MKNSYFNRNDGMIHTAPQQSDRLDEPKDVKDKNEMKQICLNCTKKKCSGSYECFKKRQKMG